MFEQFTLEGAHLKTSNIDCNTIVLSSLHFVIGSKCDSLGKPKAFNGLYIEAAQVSG